MDHVEELHDVRQQLRRLVASTGDEDFSFDVVLAAHELLANCLVHTRGGCTIAVWLDHSPAPSVRVEVADRSHEQPVMHIDGASRGLHVVDRVTSRWGVDPTVGGKVVWFEIT